MFFEQDQLIHMTIVCHNIDKASEGHNIAAPQNR